MALLPQIDNNLVINNTITLPSRTYKLIVNEVKNDRIAGFIDNINAVKQSIYHILMTERYSYAIYGNNYGVEFKQYIGKDINYIRATIESTLKEALLVDLRITNVTIIDIEQINTNNVYIEFLVTSIYGDFQMGVNVNV